jgi:hypothetical protein
MRRVELLLLLLLHLLVYLFPCAFWGKHYGPVQISILSIEVGGAVIADGWCRNIGNAAVIAGQHAEDGVIVIQPSHLGCVIRSQNAYLWEAGTVAVIDHDDNEPLGSICATFGTLSPLSVTCTGIG